jgi:hypothetical protein
MDRPLVADFRRRVPRAAAGTLTTVPRGDEYQAPVRDAHAEPGP